MDEKRFNEIKESGFDLHIQLKKKSEICDRECQDIIKNTEIELREILL